jgi:hypothetical protein
MRRSAGSILPLLTLLAAALFSSAASAQSRVIVPCPNGVPCSASTSGHIDAFGPNRLPWVVSVAAPAGVCLSVRRISTDADILRSVIAPNGAVYRVGNNDPHPNIYVNPTPIAGWYTVQLDSAPPAIEQIFSFRVDLRPTSEAHCVSYATPGR